MLLLPLLCSCLQAQQQHPPSPPLLLPGSCSFELDTCGYTSEPEFGNWSVNEEGESSVMMEGERHVRTVLSSVWVKVPTYSSILPDLQGAA